MRRVIQLLILVIAGAALAPAADPKWIQLENENFHIYSSAGERDTRDALNYFERIRSFFIQFFGAPPTKSVPIFIIAFGSEKEYQPYRLNEFAIAYYHGQAERDYIVLDRAGEDAERVAAHEYTHLVFRHAGYRLPPWFNEGMAEVFSTITESGTKTLFGRPIVGRLQALQIEQWVPLKTILEADQNSPYYNESKRAGSLDNEGWALAHMLTTTKEYRPKLSEFFNAVNSGMPSAQALEKAYGKPFAKIEEDLRLYVQGQSFNEMVANVDLNDMAKIASRPADAFDVRFLQADLLMGLQSHQAEGRTRMEQLATEFPNRFEPQSSLGYLAWRDGKQDEAAAYFARAFDAGSRTPKLMWDLARIGRRAKAVQAEQAVVELIKLDPKNAEYRTYLAGMQAEGRKFADALATLKGIENPTGDVLYQRATLALNAGDLAEAKANAEALKQMPISGDLATRTEQLVRFLDRPPVTGSTSSTTSDGFAARESEPKDVNGEPLARNEVLVPVTQRPENDEPKKPVIVLQSINGSLAEFQCSNPPRMILETEQGRKNFVVLQPDRLIVTGATGGAEFSCGAQKPAKKMRMQFSETPEGMKADGVVRAIHFGEE